MKALLLAAALTLNASEPWTRTDYALQGVLTASLVADWGQTLQIRRLGSEGNPMLGASPSKDRVHLYFAASIGLAWVVADQLPQPWRRIYQIVYIASQIAFVRSNHAVGFRVRF